MHSTKGEKIKSEKKIKKIKSVAGDELPETRTTLIRHLTIQYMYIQRIPVCLCVCAYVKIKNKTMVGGILFTSSDCTIFHNILEPVNTCTLYSTLSLSFSLSLAIYFTGNIFESLHMLVLKAKHTVILNIFYCR